MPTLIQSNAAKRNLGTPYPHYSGEVCAFRETVTIPVTAAANDIFEILSLPPGCRPVDIKIDSDDLDTDASPTVTIDVGIMSGTFGDNDATRTVAAEFFSGSTVAQAGGVASPTLKGAYRVASSSSERAIGAKINAAGTTKAAGTFGITLFYTAD